MATTNKLIWIGRLLIICLTLCEFGTAQMYYENQSCDFGKYEGICLRGSKCLELPVIAKEMGLKRTDVGHCGFTVMEEIICCPLRQITAPTVNVINDNAHKVNGNFYTIFNAQGLQIDTLDDDYDDKINNLFTEQYPIPSGHNAPNNIGLHSERRIPVENVNDGTVLSRNEIDFQAGNSYVECTQRFYFNTMFNTNNCVEKTTRSNSRNEQMPRIESIVNAHANELLSMLTQQQPQLPFPNRFRPSFEA